MSGVSGHKPRLDLARSSPDAEREGGRPAQARPREPHPPAGTAGVLGRRYLTRVIARLGELDWQATAGHDTEPEAGA